MRSFPAKTGPQVLGTVSVPSSPSSSISDGYCASKIPRARRSKGSALCRLSEGARAHENGSTTVTTVFSPRELRESTKKGSEDEQARRIPSAVTGARNLLFFPLSMLHLQPPPPFIGRKRQVSKSSQRESSSRGRSRLTSCIPPDSRSGQHLRACTIPQSRDCINSRDIRPKSSADKPWREVS